MIVVVGSRHDPVATRLVASGRKPLCARPRIWLAKVGCGDIIIPRRRRGSSTVNGSVTPRYTVFDRRSTVYAEELVTTHPADRGYLASETRCFFLTVVLATTRARVVNPGRDGAFGEEALRPARWISAASEVGITTRPVRLTTEPRRQAKYRTYEIEVVGGEVSGEAQVKIVRQRDVSSRF